MSSEEERDRERLRESRHASIRRSDRREIVRQIGLATSSTAVVAALGAATRDARPTAALASVASLAFVSRAARIWYFNWLQRDGPVEAGADVIVRASPGKGRGAFAVRSLPKLAYLGDYEGDLISNDELAWLVARGLGDYCVSSGAGAALDAMSAASRLPFTPGHLNHAKGDKANVFRVMLPGTPAGGNPVASRPRWSFYTRRAILPGEELLWTYSKAFWRGREAEIV